MENNDLLDSTDETKVEDSLELTPVQQDMDKALKSVASFIDSQSLLFTLIMDLQALVPKKKKSKDYKLTRDQLQSLWLSGRVGDDTYSNALGVNPSNIALVVLNEFMSNTIRFEVIDPAALPEAARLAKPFEFEKTTHTTIELAKERFNVPVSAELWVIDKTTDQRYVVDYKPNASGAISINIESSYRSRYQSIDLGQEMKKLVITSRFLKGQIIEIDASSGFQIVDIGEQSFPVISESLMTELEKNVINLFDKEEEFKKYGLPIKRSIILEGQPGNGKTLISKYLAAKVKGKVTTVWVTAKSIQQASDVAYVFEIARKLSPALIIMEDLDLIAGTREMLAHGGDNCLGEMLNQLDGLTSNDAIVLVGSTNAVHSLDAALNDRPGRFDRIYEVGHPEPELADKIARNYLVQRGIPQEQIDKLTLSSVLKGDFSGAQIVEIVKGGIFEAIHRNIPVTDGCIKASADGLEKQKAKIKAGKSV